MKHFCYLTVLILIWLQWGCKQEQFKPEDFSHAIENGEKANEGYRRSLNLTKAWLEHVDPESGLIPTTLVDGRKDFWEVENSAADNYPFMVLAAYLLDDSLYQGEMLDILHKEKELTSRVRTLPDTYQFSTKKFKREEPDMNWILFGSAEYIKDGLLPLLEFIGDSPWNSRMMEMLNDLPYVYNVLKEIELDDKQGGQGHYLAASEEVNGEMLQILSRVYWMTGDKKYLDWAVKIADYYLGGEHDLTQSEYLRLRDHGCEVIGGLSELYVTLNYVNPELKKKYQNNLHKLLDRVLEVGRNEDGMFFNAINAKTGVVKDSMIVDNWGYLLNAHYSVYLIDGKEEYRNAYFEAIKHLNSKYRNFKWEGTSVDGYADAIESAINLYNREPDASLKEWMDSEIKVMWDMQKNNGIVSGVYPDGNFTRTSIMYSLWKTKGIHCSPWREDLKFGAEVNGEDLMIAIKADRPWKGKLTFDRQRHKEILHLPIDYPRINQFPEWFIADREKKYVLVSSNQNLNGQYSGDELIEGITINLEDDRPVFIKIRLDSEN
ncbi:hypothetical protein [Arenibacter certesii]|uniref:Uncharacterized protein n=1 Tax=Arenibacter certesii TaxID=228955 RepID=A0A918MP75_9FLAO|nr:hypothetical protein [Arenibacter certesii]GGW41880.1 hypothetical protein GCM10007383_28140 [Arenibacter certesii]